MVKYKTILGIIDDYVEKCGRSNAKESSGLQGKETKTKKGVVYLTIDDLNNIADEIYEKYGLQVSEDENGRPKLDNNTFTLWDNESKTELRLGKILNHQEWIDFNNTGKGAYNLDEVIEFYDVMPSLMKETINFINFDDVGGACYTYPWVRGITLTTDCYGEQGTNEFYDKTMNIQRVIYHEGGHCVETAYRIIGKDRYGLKSPMRISDTDKYFNAMHKNESRFASLYGRNYYVQTDRDDSPYSEDFAETVSMVAFDKLKNKGNAQIFNEFSKVEGKKHSYGFKIFDHDEFKEEHKATYNFVKKILDGKMDLIKTDVGDDYWQHQIDDYTPPIS